MADLRDSGAFYRIGAVAQHTGLPTNTIRTWERRYRAVTPKRSSGGGRLYSDDDVERLQLIKTLVDQGDAIGAVAGLSTEALQERLQKAARGARRPSSLETTLRVGLLHGSLGPAFDSAEFGAWDMVVDEADLDRFVDSAASKAPIDVAILDLTRLGKEPEAGFERCVEAAGCDLALVVYHFASSSLLEALADAGARLVHAPVHLGMLKRIVMEQLSSRNTKPGFEHRTEPPEPASPKYDEHQLFRLRSMASTVDCECPHHLAQVIDTLIGFERYSASCESRSPRDEALHRALRRGTGQARMQMEELLGRVLEHEGIVL